MKYIAHIQSEFSGKFGVPRQSGLVPELRSRIVFEPEFRNREALRGLEDFSHIWLIWQFSEFEGKEWSPTVRPPRLGGNKRVGVFATRSPHRPNPIGLSCVALESIDYEAPEGPCLIVSGADLMDGTPIYDIKPYIPYADARPDARSGFADGAEQTKLTLEYAEGVRQALADYFESEERGSSGRRLSALEGVLLKDPRPRYQDDSQRIYGMGFCGIDVKFSISENMITITGFAPESH